MPSVPHDVVEQGVARAIKVGAPWEEGVTMGPLATAAQMKKVYGLVEKAHAAGATTLTGLFENGHSHLNNQGYDGHPAYLSAIHDTEPRLFRPLAAAISSPLP